MLTAMVEITVVQLKQDFHVQEVHPLLLTHELIFEVMVYCIQLLQQSVMMGIQLAMMDAVLHVFKK